MTYANCIKMEYKLALNFHKKSDLWEGIRVLLIDKGAKSTWMHKSIEDVAEEEVENMFEHEAQIDLDLGNYQE